MGVSKIAITENGEERTLLDLTSDTVAAENLAEGVTAHDAAGNLVTGTRIMSEPTIRYAQSNVVAQAFVDEVTYDPSDYTVSSVADYVSISTDFDKTKPVSVIVNTVSGRLVAVDSYSGIVYEQNVGAYGNALSNFIPSANGVDYVVIANDRVAQSGHLIPTGSLRQIQCTTSNVRDLGGWACDGGTVKYGMIYRGGEFNPADVDIFFNRLGIRHELNLRGETEAEEWHTQQVAAGNATMRDYVRVTVPENYVWYTIADAYKDDWRAILRCVFDCVKHKEPVYFHCSAGADRTGTVACIIEAILGVSQSDIDKEYELTNFSSGVDGDSKARRRNESEWKGLINLITAKTGSTFRDKVINWVATLGFTADEINEFRAAMVDGTPDTITLDIATYTVTNTLSNATTSNSATTVAQYQTYTADIVPTEGYIIDSVSIMMGGKDVTSIAWDGSETLLKYAVAKNLTNCVISSTIGTAITAGYAYSATLVADTGYTMEGATVSVTMGGVDVSSSYVDGRIFIQEVTGDIVITAVAVEVAVEVTVPVTWLNGKNCTYAVNSACTVSDNASYIITEEIPVKYGKTYSFDWFCPTTSSSFRLIGINDSGIVTEVVQFGPTTPNETHRVSWAATVETTTKLRLRSYSSAADSFLPITELLES